MKVALVYTSTTKELIQVVEYEVRKQLGMDVELLSYEDSSILAETRTAGHVTRSAAAKLVSLYMKAVLDGAEAILNLCSSVGEVADTAVAMGKYMGVPIVRVDEEMCKEAVRKGRRIAVLATLPTTLEPTKNTLKRVARELGKEVVLVDGLIDAFGANQDQFKKLMVEKTADVIDQVDVVLLCQGSMAYCEQLLHKTYGKLVVSSPRFGAVALKNALIDKGLLCNTDKEERARSC